MGQKCSATSNGGGVQLVLRGGEGEGGEVKNVGPTISLFCSTPIPYWNLGVVK